MGPIRIGCVPYLNARPLIAWFESDACDVEAEVVYAVPSELARQLDQGRLDVALVSSFELFRNPHLRVVPDISIAADGPVKSVRLFSCIPVNKLQSVALDTSSLTSVALCKILLEELYNLTPRYVPHAPNLNEMLSTCDGGLIIGDLKLFDTPATYILDLGDAWKTLTGLPFVYAAWLARDEADPILNDVLTHAKEWGIARLEPLGVEWSARTGLPLDRVRDYLVNVMRYDLDSSKWQALQEFRERCLRHGLIESIEPLRLAGDRRPES